MNSGHIHLFRSPTYGELKARHDEIVTDNLHNRRAAINGWMECHGYSDDTRIENEFGTEYSAHLKTYLVGFAASTQASRKTILNRYQAIYFDLLESGKLPIEFHECLKVLIVPFEKDLGKLAKATDIALGNIKAWLSGITPAFSSEEALGRLERQFGVPKGTLTNRLPHLRLGKRAYRTGQTTYGRRIQELQELPFRLEFNRWPKRAQDQWHALVKHKTAILLPKGERRHTKWNIDKRGRCISAETRLGWTENFFGFLVLSRDEDNPKLRGEGLTIEDIDFVLLSGCGGMVSKQVERKVLRIIKSDGTIQKIVPSPAPPGTPQEDRIFRLEDGTLISRIPTATKGGSWSAASILAYTKGEAVVRSLAELLADILSVLKARVWLPNDADYYVLALAVATSYVQGLFEAVPLLLATGPKNTGKSELGKAMTSVAANGEIISRASAATISRMIDRTRGFVVLDDLEEVARKGGPKGQAQFTELIQVLKLSYKRETATREITEESEQITLNYYGVKLINNTRGTNDILGSRMLEILTAKKPANVVLPTTSVQTNKLRNDLHVWAISNVDTVAKAYAAYPAATDRSEEITAPLRVLAGMSGVTIYAANLDAHLNPTTQSEDFDFEQLIRGVMDEFINRGDIFVYPSEVEVALTRKIVESNCKCYAENGAEHSPAKIHYPGGFTNVTFHPDVLTQIRSYKSPAAIFIDSMSDLMGKGVKDEWIEAVLETMRACPRHLFQLLTKNPGRLPHFQFPTNCWVGISAPPTFMFGHELTPAQQASWYDRGLEQLAKVNVPVRWTSIEPLSWDVSSIIRRHHSTLAWAVIGAGTNGQRAYQPDTDVFRAVLDEFVGIPVFFKGNIDQNLALTVAGA